VVADESEHYPVDDITVRTPCELLYQQRKKIKLVAHGIAEVPVQGGTIHGRPIPEGYARVMVDRVEPGWEDLDLEIPGGDGEEEIGQAVHTYLLEQALHTICTIGQARKTFHRCIDSRLRARNFTGRSKRSRSSSEIITGTRKESQFSIQITSGSRKKSQSGSKISTVTR